VPSNVNVANLTFKGVSPVRRGRRF
jgi:hypothetical protein